ncbi:MAG: 2OG-Fe(II) oxygenase [Deltaproteobacteria bacterium]|nr:2OG-Fe(II) oxygenase [Deltaproteobacteria bacterium]
MLREALVVRLASAIEASRAASWVEGVVAARAAWVEDFGGAQFSLGRAWYTHLEQGRAAEYFTDTEASDAHVERYCPGLQEAMRRFASRVVGGTVVQRDGWCGAGVHVFPAGALVATRGGDIHYDTEGLTPAHANERQPALTLVLMLQPATRGGALRVWSAPYRGTEAYEDEDLESPSVTCEYGVGDLVIIDSYSLHQIQPFQGNTDRISATLHVAFVEGRWESWF